MGLVDPISQLGGSQKWTWGYLRKIWGSIFLSHAVSHHDLHRRPTRFLGILHQDKLLQLGLKGSERLWNERSLWALQNSGNRLIQLVRLQTQAGWPKMVLKPSEVCPTGFWRWLRISDSPLPSSSPFLKLSITTILHLSSHCMFSCTGLRVWGNCAPGWITPRASPVS